MMLRYEYENKPGERERKSMKLRSYIVALPVQLLLQEYPAAPRGSLRPISRKRFRYSLAINEILLRFQRFLPQEQLWRGPQFGSRTKSATLCKNRRILKNAGHARAPASELGCSSSQ